MVDLVRAWRPDVPLVQEVLHARFEHHAYPLHTHDAWTVLLIDEGAVDYDLDRSEHQATPTAITLLPPHVPHDGRSANPDRAFRKHVLYLDPDWLPGAAVGAAASTPTLRGPGVVEAVRAIHGAIEEPADQLSAEGGVLMLGELVRPHLGTASDTTTDAPLARRLRDLLDDRLLETFTIAEAADALGCHRSHLVRAFTQAYGIPPHQYVVGRRVDRARRLLLNGTSPAEVAVEAGFHDQPHLTRHFQRVLGTTPGSFVA